MSFIGITFIILILGCLFQISHQHSVNYKETFKSTAAKHIDRNIEPAETVELNSRTDDSFEDTDYSFGDTEKDPQITETEESDSEDEPDSRILAPEEPESDYEPDPRILIKEGPETDYEPLDDMTSEEEEEADIADLDDDVEVRDEAGNIRSYTRVFVEQDYELQKPVNENSCLIRKMSIRSRCYQKLPLTDVVPAVIAKACYGRELLVLDPIDCTDSNQDAPLARTKRDDTKISKCCLWTRVYESECVAKRCCRRFFGVCYKRCCKMNTHLSHAMRCIEGYDKL